MADFNNLKVSELCILLNSSSYGTVIDERQLYRHRLRAGLRIAGSGGEGINLFRYMAWVFDEVHGRVQESEEDLYQRRKERAAKRSKEIALAGRDIGALPAVVDPQRKGAAAHSLRLFCESYLGNIFYMPWSPDHLKVIEKIERAVLSGGLFAVAMPRGSGKSALLEAAALWTLLYGYHQFIVVICADEGLAANMLESLKTQLESNEALAADFPEVCYPIICLEGIANRCAGQLYKGERTYIEWTAKKVTLPTIPGSPASGATVVVSGITGRIRGLKHTKADGTSVRPSLVILDDLQTDESAHSPTQCDTREQTVMGSVLGLAGPGAKISALMACTVIAKDDLADRILSHDRHPEWSGERFKLLYSFPKNMELWETYWRIRADSLRAGRNGEEATAFYLTNRQAMDEGAEVAWPERHYDDEASALQHAMNLYFRDRAAFYAEYQNEPLQEENEKPPITIEEIVAKLNRHPRGIVPITAQHLTAFIDVHASLLYYVVLALADDFTSAVIEYGTFPDQKRPYFTLSDSKQTLDRLFKGFSLERQIYEGLRLLSEKLLGRPWPREDGAEMHVERCLIDANWGQSTDIIYQFCRESSFASILSPSHGRFIGASSQPLGAAQRRPGERVGPEWKMPLVQGRRAVRYVIYNTNYWKSFTYERLKTPLGQSGTLTFWGDNPDAHRLIAEHILAEYPVRVQARGRTVDEWKAHPGRDNHFFDALVGAFVAGSIIGCDISGGAASKVEKRKRKLGDYLRGDKRNG